MSKFAKINVKDKIRRQNNFWNHIHFHPTDAIEDDWGRAILDKVAEDKAAISVRMYTMLEDIVSMDENGNFKYDFELNDLRIEYMLSRGFEIVLCYNFTPPCIATDAEEFNAVNKRKTRYKGKMINVSQPKDYKLWEEICYEYTKHVIEKFGEEEVSKWYLQCYNEPDTDSFFMKNETDLNVRVGEYCKLYEGFEKGLCRASSKLKLGGPVLAHNVTFLDIFLKFVREKNLRLDFVSFHAYGTQIGYINSGSRPICHSNADEKILDIIGTCKKHGFDNVPLVIDEWGASMHGYLNLEDCPKCIFRENEIYAAFFAKMITHYIDMQLPLDRIMICLSGQHELETEFAGCRTLFTMNGIKKPIYNAHVLARNLYENILSVETEKEENISILPTADDNGNLAVMLSYSSHNFDEELEDKKLELLFDGLDGDYTARLYAVDRDRANGYAAFLKLGAPKEISDEQMKIIKESAEIKEENLGKVNSQNPLELTLTNNCFYFVTISK